MKGLSKRVLEISLSPTLAIDAEAKALAEQDIYVFPNCSAFFDKKTNDGRKISSSTDLTKFLLDEARVAVVPGTAFGSEKHLRVSYTASRESIREGVSRIKQALEELE